MLRDLVLAGAPSEQLMKKWLGLGSKKSKGTNGDESYTGPPMSKEKILSQTRQLTSGTHSRAEGENEHTSKPSSTWSSSKNQDDSSLSTTLAKGASVGTLNAQKPVQPFATGQGTVAAGNGLFQENIYESAQRSAQREPPSSSHVNDTLDFKSQPWQSSSSSGSDRRSISSDGDTAFLNKMEEMDSFPTLNPTETNAKLEVIITDAMDYLANEGLSFPRLFSDIAPVSEMDVLINTALTTNGGKIDFIQRDDARITAGVLIACLHRFSYPIFPVSLFDAFVLGITSAQQAHPDVQYLTWKNIITEAMHSNGVSPIFLNLLGLFHLILEHSTENNVSPELLEQRFASFFLAHHDKNVVPGKDQRIRNAAYILRQLTRHIYKIFPNEVPLKFYMM